MTKLSNTPGTRGGPGDRMLAVKSRKTPENKFLFVKKKLLKKRIIFLLVMPKYWGETKFESREFPRSG